MSPESDAASAEPPAVPPPEPPEGDLEFDPDDIVTWENSWDMNGNIL
jgi:hypothetical protein